MIRVVISDSSTVVLGGTDGAILVNGPATFDCENAIVAGTTIDRGSILVKDDAFVTLLPLHPDYMASLPYGLFLAIVLAFITTRFRL